MAIYRRDLRLDSGSIWKESGLYYDLAQLDKRTRLVTSAEPCAMCFTTAWLNRISRIVFGATMEDVYYITKQKQREMTITASEMNHRSGNTIELVGGVLANDCKNIFKSYQFHE